MWNRTLIAKQNAVVCVSSTDGHPMFTGISLKSNLKMDSRAISRSRKTLKHKPRADDGTRMASALRYDNVTTAYKPAHQWWTKYVFAQRVAQNALLWKKERCGKRWETMIWFHQWMEHLQDTSSTRTRRGGSCLRDIYIYIYKTFLIYRTCMRHAPAKPVRACILRKWCPVSHVTCWSSTSHFTLHTPHFKLHTPHFTLHASHCTLHTSHFTVHTWHFTVHTSHFTVHTSHFTLHTSHFTVHTSHFTLHTALFTPHTSHCTLHTSSHLSSSHLIPAHLFSYVI